jgi:F-type H+-transporting ATPase subunit delta
MADDQLVQAYAQAIFEQAVGRWRKALRVVMENMEQAGDSLTRLDNPAEQLELKKKLVDQLLPADADGEVRNFVYLLASKSQIHMLPEVLAEFDRYASRGPVREAARVASAVQLTDAERARLEQKVRAQYGEGLDFEYRVDKSLLGGVVVRVGDKVIDGSVAGKLAAMRHKLEAAH